MLCGHDVYVCKYLYTHKYAFVLNSYMVCIIGSRRPVVTLQKSKLYSVQCPHGLQERRGRGLLQIHQDACDTRDEPSLCFSASTSMRLMAAWGMLVPGPYMATTPASVSSFAAKHAEGELMVTSIIHFILDATQQPVCPKPLPESMQTLEQKYILIQVVENWLLAFLIQCISLSMTQIS